MRLRLVLPLLCFQFSSQSNATDYFLDGTNGDDSHSGLSSEQAWRSLTKANAHAFQPGDTLQLKRGTRFQGGLSLWLTGTGDLPIVIGSYGDGAQPLIDAQGHIAGVHLKNSHHVVVRDLEITADGGKTTDGSNPGYRYGVYVQALKGRSSHITIENLTIHRIYPEIAKKHEGKNPTTFLGTAVGIDGLKEEAPSSHFIVRSCRISDVGLKAVSLNGVSHVEVLNNHMTDIGGPAIQPGKCTDIVVRGNVVIRSGSSLDPRMHARGSGIWPWTCKRVLIEKNTFMHARGAGDSCGIHIDYNCSDIIVQYNLSIAFLDGHVEQIQAPIPDRRFR